MRRFFDIEVGAGSPQEETFTKVTEGLPTEAGEYITNFGSLEFDGTTFLHIGGTNAGGGTKKFPTTVEWWMKKS